MTQKNPQPLDEETAASLTLEAVAGIKRLDCAVYRECLDQAVRGGWANFSCNSCKAYMAIDQDQRVHDNLALIVMDYAATQVEKHGHAGRIRGVKPGSERKARVRLPILVERNEGSEDLPLARLVLG